MTDYEYAILEGIKRFNDGLDKIIELLRPDHSVEERKTGKWIKYDSSYCECPFCHKEWRFENMVEYFNYCPHCGAQMMETKEGEVDREAY